MLNLSTRQKAGVAVCVGGLCGLMSLDRGFHPVVFFLSCAIGGLVAYCFLGSSGSRYDTLKAIFRPVFVKYPGEK